MIVIFIADVKGIH